MNASPTICGNRWSHLRRRLSGFRDVARKHLVARAGLRVLGERSTLLEQARFLADQHRGGTVNRHYEPQFINLYSSTWRAIADWYATDAQAFDEATVPEFLVVRRRSELLAVSPGTTDAPPICVRDNDDEVAPGLISAAGHAILDVKGADPVRIGVLFDALYGDSVSLVSGLRYEVRADNMRIDELPREPRGVGRVCVASTHGCVRDRSAHGYGGRSAPHRPIITAGQAGTRRTPVRCGR